MLGEANEQPKSGVYMGINEHFWLLIQQSIARFA